MDHPTRVTGTYFKVPFPVSVETFLDQGAPFLTAAFRACGSLSSSNSVVSIDHVREFVGGGMGRKLIIDVSYAEPSTDLHTKLFIKFPREFGDPLREVFSAVLEPEIRFSILSRQSGFPVPVPKCYFADFDHQTGSSILITETIAYGQGNIEPAHDKCLDYLLDNPLPYYEALCDALAAIAGGHKAGALGNNIDAQFPPGEADKAATIPYTETQLADKLNKLCKFAQQHPQLFPEHLLEGDFIPRFARQAPLVLQNQTEIKSLLNSNPDFFALCHWNANTDNAWFYRDEDGTLKAGLLDWGSVGQMNVAQAFYGLVCAAEADFLNAYKDRLVSRFLDAYCAHGGPRLKLEEFKLHLDLAMALLGIAWMIDAPSLIEQQVPELDQVTGRKDPKLRDDFLARAQLQLITVFLNEWKYGNLFTAVNSLSSSK
jgi:hypothetical protein